MVTVGCGDTSFIDNRVVADSSADADREGEPELEADAASEDVPATDVPIDVSPAPVPFDALAEARGIDVYAGVAPDGRSSCPYPDDTRVDNNGNTLWWWRFDWQQADLASLCASYGADAKMVIEHRMQGPGIASALPACTNSEVMGYGDHACAMEGLVRLEVECTAGYVLFEATKDWDVVHWDGPGYYHIESSAAPLLTRRMMMVDRTCGRLVHPRFVPMAPAGSPEVGVDTASTSAYASMLGWYDPYENGQPCRSGKDCPIQHVCFVDGPVTDCQNAPLGHCVPLQSSNTCALNRTCGWCLVLFGKTCTGFPGYSCALTSCGWACAQPADAGIDSQ